MIVGELAQQVRDQHDDHEVGRVAVEAAHDAGVVPVVVGQVLDRLVGALDPGIEEDEEIDSADRDDPEEEEAERAELRERIERRAEQPVERPLDPLESVPQHAADDLHAGLMRAPRGATRAG